MSENRRWWEDGIVKQPTEACPYAGVILETKNVRSVDFVYGKNSYEVHFMQEPNGRLWLRGVDVQRVGGQRCAGFWASKVEDSAKGYVYMPVIRKDGSVTVNHCRWALFVDVEAAERVVKKGTSGNDTAVKKLIEFIRAAVA